MRVPAIRWSAHIRLIVELFIVFNLAFLALEIFLAHSMDEFRDAREWIPFYFSLVATALLVLDLVCRRIVQKVTAHLGLVVGLGAIVIGIGGLVLHLQSQFWYHPSMGSLVYRASFAAPLAYTGLGILLIVNRYVSTHERSWGQYVILLGLCGFLVTFVMVLLDHAQNGFFYVSQLIPVFSCAFAVSFLTVALLGNTSRLLLNLCFGVLVIQCIVGVGGFYYHLAAILNGPSSSMYDNFIYTAPLFVPLLLIDLSLFSAIGLWHMRSKMEVEGRWSEPVKVDTLG